jgi:hypothetical protein
MTDRIFPLSRSSPIWSRSFLALRWQVKECSNPAVFQKPHRRADMQRTLGRLFVVFALAGMAGCGGGNLGAPAVTDGLTLQYQVGEEYYCQVSFKAIDDKLFRVELEPPGCSVKPDGVSEEEMIVDAWLRLKDGRTPQWGEAVYLWLPESRRTVGKHGAMEVSRAGEWGNWSVAVVEGSFGILSGVWYYDLKTGFLVGFEKTFAGDRSLIYKLLEMTPGS